jgi:hypothetical protein
VPAPSPSSAEKQEQSKRVDDLAKREKEVEPTDDTNGVFGPFRIGPVVGVGLPSFLSFGGAIKLTKYFGAGLNFGIVPKLQFAYYGDATVSYQAANIYGHIHPLGGGFFLGAAIGYGHARATYTEEFDIKDYVPPGSGFPTTLPYTSEATVQMLLLTPELGYFFTFKSGFTFGVDAGVQIPIAPSEIRFESHVNTSLPQAVEDQIVEKFIAPTDARVESTLERLAQTILPTFGIKMGWLF